MKVSKEDKRANQQPSPDEGKVQRLSKTRSRAEVSRVGRKLEARGSSYRVIGIYAIECKVNGKIYIGKSINICRRLIQHKCNLTSKTFIKKSTNRALYKDVQKYGWGNFECYIIEQFPLPIEDLIADRELHWMRQFRTTDPNFGYNRRLDSETKMIVHPETRKLISEAVKGEKNPNYGNYWTDEQKRHMSQVAKSRHGPDGPYNEEWRRKIGESATIMWKDEGKKRRMAEKVAEKKRIFDFFQFTKDGQFIRKWESIKEILDANPGLRRAGIYNSCCGYRPHYRGYVWKKELKI